MEQYFAGIFEDIRPDRSILLLLSLTDPNIRKQTGLTDFEITMKRSLALEKLHGQKSFKEFVALHLQNNYFLFFT